jgi:protein phosphatase
MTSNTDSHNHTPNSADSASAVPALLIGAATHPGQRRPRNEDSFCIADASLTMPDSVDTTNSGALRADTLSWPKGSLLVLTDGVGGLGSGEVAAQTSARVAYQTYYAHRTEIEEAQAFGRESAIQAATDASLRHSIQVAHESVRRLIEQQGSQASISKPGMASTIVMAVVQTRHVTVANVGDSRCYLLQAGQLQQLSTDHSWVAEQVRAGLISPHNAEKHDLRNVLSQSVGAADAPPTPTLAHHAWGEYDRLLLCSDGLWGQLSASQITELLRDGDDPQTIANRLVVAANAAGGTDNITAIVAFNHVGPAKPKPISPRRKALVVLSLVLAALGLGLGVMAIRNAIGASSASSPRATPQPPPSVTRPPPTALPAPTPSPTPNIPPTATRLGQPTATPVITVTATIAPALISATDDVIPEVTSADTSVATSATTNSDDIKFCRAANLRASQCSLSLTEFRPRNRLAYAVWKLDVVRAAEQISIEWYRNDELIESAICTLRSVGNTVRCAENGVLPTQASINTRQVGRYRLQIRIAERAVLTDEFTVK